MLLHVFFLTDDNCIIYTI